MVVAGSSDLSPAMDTSLRVAVVDEPELVTAGLASMLEAPPAGQRRVVGLVPAEGGPRPDLVLCDPLGRARPPEQYLTAVAARFPVPLVAFTWDTDPALVRRVLAAGARAWLPKTTTSARLVETLVAAYDGTAAAAFVPPAPAPALVRLSRREREVLSLICRGHSNAEIAEQLYVSVNSVKTYVRQMYQKTGVSRRAQAVAWGLENGF